MFGQRGNDVACFGGPGSGRHKGGGMSAEEARSASKGALNNSAQNMNVGAVNKSAYKQLASNHKSDAEHHRNIASALRSSGNANDHHLVSIHEDVAQQHEAKATEATGKSQGILSKIGKALGFNDEDSNKMSDARIRELLDKSRLGRACFDDDVSMEKEGKDCQTCKGSGKIMGGHRKCPDCGGSGKK